MVGFIIIALLITVAFSRLDAVNHYYYVGQIQSECFGPNQYSPQGNPNKICIDEYNKLGLPIGDQRDIPNKYNESLNQNLTIVAFAFAGSWLMFSLVLDHVRHTKPDPINVYFVVVIVMTIGLPCWTGMGDMFYFYWLNIQQPPIWQWLDSAGIMPYILQYTHDADVTLNDMYIAVSMGIIAMFVLWIPIIITFATASKRKLIDLL